MSENNRNIGTFGEEGTSFQAFVEGLGNNEEKQPTPERLDGQKVAEFFGLSGEEAEELANAYNRGLINVATYSDHGGIRGFMSLAFERNDDGSWNRSLIILPGMGGGDRFDGHTGKDLATHARNDLFTMLRVVGPGWAEGGRDATTAFFPAWMSNEQIEEAIMELPDDINYFDKEKNRRSEIEGSEKKISKTKAELINALNKPKYELSYDPNMSKVKTTSGPGEPFPEAEPIPEAEPTPKAEPIQRKRLVPRPGGRGPGRNGTPPTTESPDSPPSSGSSDEQKDRKEPQNEQQSRWAALKERFTNPETGKLYTVAGGLGRAATWAYVRAQTSIYTATEQIKDKTPERAQTWLEKTKARRWLGRAAMVGAGIGIALVFKGDLDLPDFSGFGGETPAVDQSPVPETSPSPEVAEPTAEPTTESPDRPLADELLEQHGADVDAARTIEAGEGVDNTLREMGIEDPSLRQELTTDTELRDTLVDRGVAYEAGDTIGWNKVGELDNQTIEDIYERAAELELSDEETPVTPETQETPQEAPLNEAPEPPSEIERAQAEAFTDALDMLEANPAETFESLNIPQGGGGEQLLQAINREFWPNGVMAIDQSAWYDIEDQLVRDYPQDFYRMADGHVGLMRPGYISEQAKNGLVEILRARGYANLAG